MEHYFLSQCTLSSRLVPAHNLCSILMIVTFRRVEPNNPIKNAILDVSRSPPNRNSKRRPDDRDPQPPTKRQKSSSGQGNGLIPNYYSRRPSENDTFDESLMFVAPTSVEPDTQVETELDILYTESEKREAEMNEHGYDEAISNDHRVGFQIIDELEIEEHAVATNASQSVQSMEQDTDVTEAEGCNPSLIWDNDHDLVNLQTSVKPTHGSTPSKRVQFQMASELLIIENDENDEKNKNNISAGSDSIPTRDRPNDSPPSSCPEPLDSEELDLTGPEMENHEVASQITVSMETATVSNRPLLPNDSNNEISLHERSDNAQTDPLIQSYLEAHQNMGKC